MIVRMHFHDTRESQSDARGIELQRTNQAPRDPLLVPLDAVACDDGGGREDEVGAKRLDDRGRKDGGPIGLLRWHRRYDNLGDKHRQSADRQDPLSSQSWNEPCSDKGSAGRADRNRREADGGREDGPVADLLLPGDEIPDEGAVGHEAEEDDKDEWEE